MSDLKSKTIRAAGWVLGSQVISQAVSFGFGVTLARLLVPDDFGLVAMVLVFSGLASLFSDVGLASSLIQKKDVDESHYCSVFWVNIILGCVVGFILYLSSSAISVFYGRLELEGIIKVLSVSYPIAAISTVPSARLTKALNFKFLKLSEMASMIVSGVFAIALAINGFGYWSLVFQRLLQLIILTVLVWKFSRWQPKMGISLHSIKDLWVFSSFVFLTTVLRYGMQNLDKIIIGKFLGGPTLGIYDRAYSTMLMPLRSVSSGIGSVMFPSLSIIQSDKHRVKQVYLRSIATIALVTFPMMAGMFVVAESFVLGVLGNQWVEVIPILRIFCIAGLMLSIVGVTGSLFKSQGAAKLQLRTSLITIPIRMAGVIIGLQWGLVGVAIGFSASLVITSIITLTTAYRLVNLRFFTMIRAIVPILIPMSLMAVIVWFVRPLSGLENELFLFLLQAVMGVIAYCGINILIRPAAYVDVINVLRGELISKRKST